MNQVISPPSKLPQIVLSFWIMKICATTLGETAGDLLAQTMEIGYLVSSLILLGFFFITLIVQLSSKAYHPIIYWLVILSTSTAGTTVSDFMNRTLGLGYASGSLILISLLALTLIIWKATEKTLAVSNVRSTRAEIFYWTAILFSNTLGTALGDYLADDSGLGFSGGALLIGGLIGLVTLAYYFTKVSHVFLFWSAFILTRPFGATFGDFLTKPIDHGGLDFGTIGSSAILLVILIALVVNEIIKQRKSAPIRTSE